MTALIGVALVSPDGLLVNAMSATVPTTLLLRGVLLAMGLLGVMKLRTGRVFRSRAWAMGWNGVAFAVFSAIGNVLFVASLRRTSVAHTLFITAAVPAITGVLGRLAQAETVPRRTWVTALGILAGVGLLVASDPGRTLLIGDLEALGAALSLSAGLLVVPRSDDARVTAAQALSAVLVAVAVIPWVAPGTVTGKDLSLAVVGFMVLMPAANTLILGSRRQLAAVEVSLLLLLESVLGPLWVWIGLGQRPTWQTMAAGTIILTSVAGHALSGRQPPVSFST
jgi:drug/metabolite transporter (DMT)-like permease